MWYSFLFKDIPVATFSASHGYLIKESTNEYLKQIGERHYEHRNYSAAFEALDKNNLVMADSVSFLDYTIRKRYTNRYVAFKLLDYN